MVQVDRAEPLDRFQQSFAERNGRPPTETPLGQRDVRPPLHRIVDRQGLPDELRPRAGQFQDEFGQFEDRELLGIAEVHRPDEIVRAVHHADHSIDQFVAVAEGACLRAVAEDRDVLAGQRLTDEVRHHAAVEGVHAGAVGSGGGSP